MHILAQGVIVISAHRGARAVFPRQSLHPLINVGVNIMKFVKIFQMPIRQKFSQYGTLAVH